MSRWGTGDKAGFTATQRPSGPTGETYEQGLQFADLATHHPHSKTDTEHSLGQTKFESKLLMHLLCDPGQVT